MPDRDRISDAFDRADRKGEAIAVKFGRYVLLERLSRGGMAEVYRAKTYGSDGFEKVVAIKRILPHLAEDQVFREMFIDEAKLCSNLSHPNICPVYELGRTSESLFLAMEYIWGRDLLQVWGKLQQKGKLVPIPYAVYVIARVLEGLDYAHRRTGANGEPLGIVHRDVSPQNVLLSYEGSIKVIDFGIARVKQRQTRRTGVGMLKGKFGYMSPEQVRGEEVDRRTDVFTAGILLYEMMTGTRLFAGQNDLDTLERIREARVPTPTRRSEEVPEALAAIIKKSLALDANDRFQWANLMAETLDRFLVQTGQLVTAGRLSGWMYETFVDELGHASAASLSAAEYSDFGLVASSDVGPVNAEATTEEAAIVDGGQAFAQDGVTATVGSGADDEPVICDEPPDPGEVEEAGE